MLETNANAHRTKQQEKDQPSGVTVFWVLTDTRGASHAHVVRRARQSAIRAAYMGPVSRCVVGLPEERSQAEGEEEQPDPGGRDSEALVDCADRRGSQQIGKQQRCYLLVAGGRTVQCIVDVDQDDRHRDA